MPPHCTPGFRGARLSRLRLLIASVSMRSRSLPGRPGEESSGLAAFDDVRNNNTIVPPGFRDVTTELAASLERERSAIETYFAAELPSEVELAARVALLTSDEAFLHELPGSPDAYLVVGRHTEASVRAEGATSLSLRHVLLIPQRSDSTAGVALDIVALAPTMRVGVWPRPLPAVLAGRCTALVLGDSLLLVAPIERAEGVAEVFMAPDVASGLPPQRRPQPVAQRQRASAGSAESADSLSHSTRISMAMPSDALPDAADACDAELVLEVCSDDGSVRVPLREPWLVGGIVLGRNADKCSHSSIARLLTSPEVSRCHLYLRREHNEIVLYDTASTSGVRLGEDDEELVRRVAVPAPLGALARGNPDAINPARIQLWLSTDVRLTIFAAGERVAG